MTQLVETVSLDGPECITVQKFFATESFAANVKKGVWTIHSPGLPIVIAKFSLLTRGTSTSSVRPDLHGKAGVGELLAFQRMLPQNGSRLCELEENGYLAYERFACPNAERAWNYFIRPIVPGSASRRNFKKISPAYFYGMTG